MPKKGTSGRVERYKRPVVKSTHGRGKRMNTSTRKTTTGSNKTKGTKGGGVAGAFLHKPAKYFGVRSDSTVKKKTAERKAHSFDKAKRGSKRKRGSRGGR